MSVIQLGAPGALRKYVVKARGDGLMWGRGPASPFSAKVNSSSKYDQVDIWNEWVQEDWQAGVGRVNPEEGGFLYGEIDSRVPNQLILPIATGFAHVRPYTSTTTSYLAHLAADAADYTTVDIAVGATPQKVAARISYDYSGSLTDHVAFFAAAFYGFLDANVGLTFYLHTDSAGLPAASAVASGTIQASQDAPLRPTWYGALFSVPYKPDLTADATYWIAVGASSGGTFTLAGASTNANSASAQQAPGGAWSALTTFFPIFSVATGVVRS